MVPAGKQRHTFLQICNVLFIEQCHLEKLSLIIIIFIFFWLNHTSRSATSALLVPSGGRKPRQLYLRNRSSGSAVSQAGAAALVRELQRGGDRKAGRRGPRETKRGGRLVGASVLEQDVDAFLTSCATGQSQRRLPLSVPMTDVAAILRGPKQKAELAGLLHNEKKTTIPTVFVYRLLE